MAIYILPVRVWAMGMVQGLNRIRGATMVEYALLASLVAIACISSVSAMRTKIACRFKSIGSALTASPIPSIYVTACDGSGGGGGSGGGSGGSGGGSGGGAGGGTGGGTGGGSGGAG